MKKVLLITMMGISLVSCSVYLPIPKTIVSITDYSIFKEKGLYVTESNSVNFDYEAISHVSLESYAGWVEVKGRSKIEPSKKTFNDDYYTSSSNSNVFNRRKYTIPNIDDAVSLFADKIKEINGNGVMNLKFEYRVVPDDINPKINISTITISGMAIKK